MLKLAPIAVAIALCLSLAGCPKSGSGGGSSGADGGSAHVPGSQHDAGSMGGGNAGTTGGSTDAGSGQPPGHGPDAGGTLPGGKDAGTVSADAGAPSSDCNPACAAYQHCALVQVQCIKAPCPPLSQCVDNPTCGGIAARPCPGSGQCVDDPRDSCDPNKGGADCGGLCVCVDKVLCVKGKVWDSTQCTCVAAATGPTCGKTTCPVDQECCNASCGICTPPGGACTQQACL